MRSEYLKGLNRQQRIAVRHGVKNGISFAARPLLIVAGAGTGKTNTLVHRVAHLVVNGADPRRLLLLTFTRQAAKEMNRRASGILSGMGRNARTELPYAGTFHAIGALVLKEFAAEIGLKRNFTIRDRPDSADAMNLLRSKLGYADSDKKFPDKALCLAIYSYKTNACANLDAVIDERYPSCRKLKKQLKKLFEAYRAAKREQNVVDYDDLLLLWAKLLRKPSIAKKLGDRFQYVLIDEYQDTNKLQSRILHRLKPEGSGITVVGDDAQAIYSFRAATVDNILYFADQFTRKARVVKLEQNYRSTQPILDVSNSVMKGATDCLPKELWSTRISTIKPLLTSVEDDADQAAHVADQILGAREKGIEFKEQAVLIRASHHSAKLEIELAHRKIPFQKWGGLKFLDAAHIKDVLSVLKWAENPGDEVAGFRALQLLPGVGPGKASAILEATTKHHHGKRLTSLAAPVAPSDWAAFVKMMRRLDNSEWTAQLHRVVKWYLPVMKHDDVEHRKVDLAQLEVIGGDYESRESFLMQLSLEPPERTAGPLKPIKGNDDCLTISTIHSAKGQEWKRVFILSAVDGCIPSSKVSSPAQLEEERRLLHVAMTRAKDELEVLVPRRLSSARNGGTVIDLYSSPTMFLKCADPNLFKRITAKPETELRAARRRTC